MKDSIQNTRPRIWSLPPERESVAYMETADALCRDLGIHSLTARLLVNRGYTDAVAAELFFSNDERIFHDPRLMADMDAATERTLRAVLNHEHIVIYGDYDVDGVTSVTSLYLYLKGLGARVSCYIPNRIGEGYGMSVAAVEKLAERGTTLIITVDTGITANREIEYAASLGMDTVVTDHHECHGDLPTCVAVVNPHRPDCSYPFKELAGVGVVFKFICACEAARASLSPSEALSVMADYFIDLVAIGTIADVMPIEDENRYIVSRGLAMLDHTDRPGLVALLDAISGGSQVKSAADLPSMNVKKPRRRVNSGLVGFGIAPRINAAGRIAHAMQAVDLLLADSEEQATILAGILCEINTRRQVEENRIAEQAYAMIDEYLAETARVGAPAPRVLVLEDDGWMQGIVGIVSSRITEKYGLPSILISFDGAVTGEPHAMDIGKGSGRSVKGLNLVDALANCDDLLVRFGGHELAAGLTIRRGNIEEFRERINAYAAERLTEDMIAVRYEADADVAMDEMTMELAEELERLEPFGVGNPTPLLILRDAVVQKIIPLGAGKHTKLMLYKDGRILPAIWFGVSPGSLSILSGDTVDVLFHLNINDYQGVRSLQLIVQDLRPAAEAVAARIHVRERFDAIMAGGNLCAEDGDVPDRTAIAAVFTVLREDARLGNATVSERSLLDRTALRGKTMSGVCLRVILHILGEMGVASIREVDDGIFCFAIDFDAPKTSIDASPLLQRLRAQAAGTK